MWNRALTEAEVATGYATDVWDSPQVYLSFGEQSGMHAFDQSGQHAMHERDTALRRDGRAGTTAMQRQRERERHAAWCSFVMCFIFLI